MMALWFGIGVVVGAVMGLLVACILLATDE